MYQALFSAAGIAGGGGAGGMPSLSASSSAEANGDNAFNHDFNYQSGNGINDNQLLIIGAVTVIALVAFSR
ncbi:hypothetical protein J7384_10225 [Endozoicomonas sp. G2_1]|uniref:hypothetical protein n=1 Tax=Endozoicomonas sp. G2_1 TaxID=2821091 RepID=UPI001ADA2074|nr:hypothetical protein [Endozoicomonas sp. G2_1]MBO9490736.1 hypothetical protein [Endozoicomonas sp. G2_1]